MNKRYFCLVHDIARQNATKAVREAPDGWVVTIKEPTRNLEQNAAQWPILQAFSEQVPWPVNGHMVFMSPEEWKDVLTAAFHREHARIANAFDGRGVVMLGMRTSEMSKGEFSEWLDFLKWAAAERDVKLPLEFS